MDSTNNYIAKLAKEGKLDSGTVIMADEQFEGRGRRGTDWSAEAGKNLTMSLFTKDVNMSVDRQFNLTKIVALSVHRYLFNQGVDARIKWPNDLLVNDRKICGVLIENQIRGMEISESVIGIGLNVNQENFDDLNATSMSLQTNQNYIMHELCLSICHQMNECFQLYTNSPHLLERDYLNALDGFQEKRKYTVYEDTFVAEITRVTENGKLCLKRDNGEKEYSLDEVKRLF